MSEGFVILPSLDAGGATSAIPADVATCPECLQELFTPTDRRFRYPFINCTNCGPRLTIIRALPYDRPATTMSAFEMCTECRAEYLDPTDRRFHAQPVACSKCGPGIRLEVAGKTSDREEAALLQARRRLAEGAILAVKGLGGFHLACDAANARTVNRLRERKGRGEKPFAVMLPDLAAVACQTRLSPDEARVLGRRDRPVVILDRLPESDLAASLAPGQATLGVMLPYTPLHHLLLEREAGFPTALVMTSGNRSGEPIAAADREAREGLGDIADAFLLHDRPIHQRCDDSVQRVFRGGDYLLRRSRGRVPDPVPLRGVRVPVLAVGGEQKNTFCLARDGQAILGPHMGDLENESSLGVFEESIAHLEALTRFAPERLACDAHPDYLATRYAERRAERDQLPLIRVQHHHAHIASLLAETNAEPDRPVIGLAFDGSGYGDDGTIWGGEVLLADLRSSRRLGHLAAVAMPGGEAAIREPWRMGLAWARHAGVAWDSGLPSAAHASDAQRAVVDRMLAPEARASGLNVPFTSSLGRLFDAVASLAGVRHDVRDEGQAAIELEALADPAENGTYEFAMEGLVFDPAPLIAAIAADVLRSVPAPTISARFHNAVVGLVLEICRRARGLTGVNRVGLSGGVWQNRLLLERAVTRLEDDEFEVLVHRLVPPNDGGLALGQAAIAAWRRA